MSLEIEIVNPLERKGWDNFILSLPGHTFFHSSVWAKVLHETYGYQPIAFIVKNNGHIVAMLTIMEVNSIFTGRRGVSLPFTDFCKTILVDHDAYTGTLEKLLDYGRRNRWKYVELRGSLLPMMEGACYANYYHHELALCDDFEAVSREFRSSTRRNIKKSLSEGVVFNISTSFDAVENFYSLNCITRKRHGLPPQPFKFFKNIYAHVISKGNGIVVTAEWMGKTISASVFFHFGNKAIYKYGASDHEYQHLRANNLVMSEAIKWYCLNGYDNFSFGRTDIDHDGLLQFKRGWGVTEEKIPYFRFDPRSGESIRGSEHKHSTLPKYSSMLPIAALRTLGTLMYKHVG